MGYADDKATYDALGNLVNSIAPAQPENIRTAIVEGLQMPEDPRVQGYREQHMRPFAPNMPPVPFAAGQPKKGAAALTPQALEEIFRSDAPKMEAPPQRAASYQNPFMQMGGIAARDLYSMPGIQMRRR